MTETAEMNSGTSSPEPTTSLQSSRTPQQQETDKSLAEALGRLLNGKEGRPNGEIADEPAPEGDETGGEAHQREPGASEVPAGAQTEETESREARREAEQTDFTVKELAERLRMPAKKVYNELKVPLGNDGRHISLQELKDGYLKGEAGSLDQDRYQLSQEKLSFERDRIVQENRAVQTKREVERMVDHLVDVIPPNMLDPLRALVRKDFAREAEQLVESLPQLGEPGVYAKFMKDAAATLEPFGFSAAEVQNITDHRIHRVIDAHLRLLKRVAELEDIKPDQRKPPKTYQPSAKPAKKDAKKAAVDRAKASGSLDDQIAAGRALLGL